MEKPIEIQVGDGIVVTGRIDLIRRLDTDEVAIVDFKSTERSQLEDISREQLHVYAVGYQQLTGKSAHLVEVHNLDHGGSNREVVDARLLNETLEKVRAAGKALLANHLPRHKRRCPACASCEHAGICR